MARFCLFFLEMGGLSSLLGWSDGRVLKSTLFFLLRNLSMVRFFFLRRVISRRGFSVESVPLRRPGVVRSYGPCSMLLFCR